MSRGLAFGEDRFARSCAAQPRPHSHRRPLPAGTAPCADAALPARRLRQALPSRRSLLFRQLQEDPASCACTLDINPVCGTSGTTYENRCLLECAGDTLAAEGACPTTQPTAQGGCDPTTPCTLDINPVCAASGKTYDNLCLLECAGETLAAEGACPTGEPSSQGGCDPATPCTLDINPVCAASGKTYDNLCLLECAGETLAYKGECTPSECGWLAAGWRRVCNTALCMLHIANPWPRQLDVAAAAAGGWPLGGRRLLEAGALCAPMGPWIPACT